MKLLVCGGRNFGEFYTSKNVARSKDIAINERWFLKRVLDNYNISFIVQGFAKGADRMALLYADKNGIPHTSDLYKPEWNQNGVYIPYAGNLRNQRMLDQENPDLIIAFPGGRGTADMVSRSSGQGYKIFIPLYSEQEDYKLDCKDWSFCEPSY